MANETENPLDDLSSEQQEALVELAQQRVDNSINRREAGKLLGGLGLGALVGGGGAATAIGSASAQSTSNSYGDVGEPGDRVDVFANGVDTPTLTDTDTGTTYDVGDDLAGGGGIFEDTNSDGIYEQTTGSGISTDQVSRNIAESGPGYIVTERSDGTVEAYDGQTRKLAASDTDAGVVLNGVFAEGGSGTSVRIAGEVTGTTPVDRTLAPVIYGHGKYYSANDEIRGDGLRITNGSGPAINLGWRGEVRGLAVVNTAAGGSGVRCRDGGERVMNADVWADMRGVYGDYRYSGTTVELQVMDCRVMSDTAQQKSSVGIYGNTYTDCEIHDNFVTGFDTGIGLPNGSSKAQRNHIYQGDAANTVNVGITLPSGGVAVGNYIEVGGSACITGGGWQQCIAFNVANAKGVPFYQRDSAGSFVGLMFGNNATGVADAAGERMTNIAANVNDVFGWIEGNFGTNQAAGALSAEGTDERNYAPKDLSTVTGDTGQVAYNDGTTGTEGPAAYTSAGNWVSLVDGTTI